MSTAKRRGRPPATESPAALTDILSAALKTCAETGYDGTSAAALNRELGVSHNLIHQRFGSKEDLWYAAVDWAFGEIEDEITIDPQLADSDLMEALRRGLIQLLEVHARHPEILRMVTVEGAHPGPRLTYLFDAHIHPLYARLTTPLKTLVDRGVLTDVDVRSLHFLVAHGATSPFSLAPLATMLEPVDPLDPTAVRRHAEFVADLVVAGLRARGA